MHRIKFPRNTQRRLKRHRYVPVSTTFVTEDGPAERTIWFDAERPTAEPMIVMYCKNGFVQFFDIRCDTFETFMDRVKAGRYVLVGVLPPPHSHTVV